MLCQVQCMRGEGSCQWCWASRPHDPFLTVAFVPRLTEGGTTLSYLEGLSPVSCRAVSAAATCV